MMNLSINMFSQCCRVMIQRELETTSKVLFALTYYSIVNSFIVLKYVYYGEGLDFLRQVSC